MTQYSWTYIMTNSTHNVLYTGVTTDIETRVKQHRAGEGSAFTRKYRCDKLVYLEEFDDVKLAIAREKQIKAGSRANKMKLVQGLNPEWRDLAEIWEQLPANADPTARSLESYLEEKRRRAME